MEESPLLVELYSGRHPPGTLPKAQIFKEGSVWKVKSVLFRTGASLPKQGKEQVGLLRSLSSICTGYYGPCFLGVL